MPTESKKAITLPTDAACLNFFKSEETEHFHCLSWIFDSGLKRWTQVSSWITYLWWKFSGLACNWISPGKVNPFQFVLWCQHSWDPSCWQLAHLQDLRTGLTIKCQPMTIIQWMSPVCSSVMRVFQWSDQRSSSVLSLLSFFIVASVGDPQQISVLCLHLNFIGCHYFSFADILLLLRQLFYPFLDLSRTFHLCMGLICTEI